MTDDKSKTPGMAEVSVEFEHEPTAEEAERKARAKARDEIDAVLAKLPPRGTDETQIEHVHRKVLALRQNAPPRGCSDEEMAAWVDRHDRIEEAIGILRAQNLHDVEIKLAILCDRLRENLTPGQRGEDGDFLIALTARDDLRRIAGERSAIVPEDPVLALKREWDARYERIRSEPDESDEVMDPLQGRLLETEYAIHRTPATTPAGVAIKIWLWTRTFSPGWESPAGQDWWEIPVADMPDILDHMPIASALQDLERMAGTGAAITTQTSTAAASSETDLVAQIGRDLATTWRQVWRNDEKRPSSDAPSAQGKDFERLEMRLSDRWPALESMAAEIQAGSLEGAMVQIMLAHAEADTMAASTEESNESQMRTIGKLLYSALAVLEQTTGVPREELGGEAYMRRDLDPHALVAAAEDRGPGERSVRQARRGC